MSSGRILFLFICHDAVSVGSTGLEGVLRLTSMSFRAGWAAAQLRSNSNVTFVTDICHVAPLYNILLDCFRHLYEVSERFMEKLALKFLKTWRGALSSSVYQAGLYQHCVLQNQVQNSPDPLKPRPRRLNTSNTGCSVDRLRPHLDLTQQSDVDRSLKLKVLTISIFILATLDPG